MRTIPKEIRNSPIYVDTNVWMDFVERNDESATRFFHQMAACKYSMLISELVVAELIHNDSYDKNLIEEYIAAGKLRIVPVTSSIRALAKTFKTHVADGIHSATAFQAGVPVLTRNLKDFTDQRLIVVAPNDIK